MSSQRRLLEFLGVACVSLGVVFFTRWRLRKELNQRRSKKKLGSINIGGIFGMDVGGTLTKIVYFERTTRPTGDGKDSDQPTPSPASAPRPTPTLKRGSSIDRMDTPAHIAALDEMHKYMVRCDCTIIGIHIF